ncbi:MAG: TIGR03960 family B12-binding radical SAM protein [Christensenellaceae bacterium]
MNDTLRQCLMNAEKPSRYVGGEVNAPTFVEGRFSFCMCFPEVYEVGMSNLGTKIVAKSMQDAGFGVDWCFAPWADFGGQLKERNVPLYSLTVQKPLKDFDMVAFSLGFELSYTNVLWMLDLAQIPLLRRDRDERYPIVACGGPCTVNPAPLVDFVDLFFIGDGEEVDAEVGRLFERCLDRETFLREAAKIRGVYVPGYSAGVTKRAYVADLDGAVFPSSFMVPNVEAVHDRAVIEVMRGCYRGCRFCQAGFLYRPVRVRSVETLTRQACDILKSTGYDELSLNSLSTGDYPHLRELIRSLKEHVPADVDMALPSLRVDSFDAEFAQDSRLSSLTFAPEAGTQRLRDVINKDVTLDEILKAADSAFGIGYSSVKLYFMFGLPTETDEDLLGIRDIAEQIASLYYQTKRKQPLRISISASTFIPKPFTPFQWERQASEAEVAHKVGVLKDALRMRGVRLSWNDYFTSRLEACLARGDERLGAVLLAAYKNGCKFDSWTEQLNKAGWQRAFEDCGVDMNDYTRAFGEDEILPWDRIDIGVSKAFFLRERHRAYAEKSTGGCLNGCKGCGLQESCPKAREGV